MKLRVLVVGAGGFLGGRLLQSDDARVEWIGATRFNCDVTDRVSWDTRGSSASIHPWILRFSRSLATAAPIWVSRFAGCRSDDAGKVYTR
jgi:hypothetical protein